jgi:CheY-like chemotaxis protein
MTSADQPRCGSRTFVTALVVDDEILERLAISAYLRECGFRVIEAANTDEALLALQQPHLSIDVVLSDVEMPGSLDGFALARWLREHKPGLRILLAATPERAANIAGEICADGPLLMRPYDPKILLDEIKRTLASAAAARN